MNIFIATDGSLNLEKTVDLVSRLKGPDDQVIVFTAIHFPRQFLHTFAEVSGADQVAAIADAAGSQLTSGGRAAEQLAGTPGREADPQQVTDNYFEVMARRTCTPLLDALGDAGADAELMFSHTENQTARTILAEAEVKNADVLVLGSHGQGKFEGPLGSTVTKLVRRSTIPVLLVR
ncbi:MAG: universal stress protein [Acidimicrobiales bacterium]